MYAYIARQPIFDRNCKIAAYELLYRDAPDKNRAEFMDGDKATCRLLSDAVTQFGLTKLTDGKVAYVNFTENLLLNDFVSLANPRDIVVELLEGIKVTEPLTAKIKELKESGYRFALDDYIGDHEFDPLLPYVRWVKVDFMQTSPEEQAELVHRFRRNKNISFLAEKVETQEEFERAKKLGYRYFQGYFFAKPQIMSKRVENLAYTSYANLLSELQKSVIDMERCTKIIQSDVSMTYRIMRQAQTLRYYRGNMSRAISHAIMLIGTDEIRRMILLSLARENNVTRSDALIRSAYQRGVFAKRLMTHCKTGDNTENGFILGMFSLLDRILGIPMEEVLGGLELPSKLVRAFMGEEDNYYAKLLQYIVAYESGEEELPDIGLEMDPYQVSRMYMESLVETDETFLMT